LQGGVYGLQTKTANKAYPVNNTSGLPIPQNKSSMLFFSIIMPDTSVSAVDFFDYWDIAK